MIFDSLVYNHNLVCPCNKSIVKTFMLNQTNIIDYLTKQIPDLLGIYAFGSQIKQTAHADSDIDLAVLTTRYIKPVQLWQLANQLANNLNTDVDLIDLRATSTVMQYQIITTGHLLYAKDAQIDLFRCFVLSEKMELDNARQKLLTRIQQQGYVYGR
jgi:predicted nucleotidyltransferase